MQGNVVGGNVIGWRIVVNKDLVDVDEKGVGKSKRESDKKIDNWWLFLNEFSMF
jgi:hypothetical protein